MQAEGLVAFGASPKINLAALMGSGFMGTIEASATTGRQWW